MSASSESSDESVQKESYISHLWTMLASVSRIHKGLVCSDLLPEPSPRRLPTLVRTRLKAAAKQISPPVHLAAFWVHPSPHFLPQCLRELAICLFCHIHLNPRQPTTTSSSIATTSCRENSFTISRRKKMISKGSRNPEAQIFMLWGINKVIFCWQKSVDCTGFYFD